MSHYDTVSDTVVLVRINIVPMADVWRKRKQTPGTPKEHRKSMADEEDCVVRPDQICPAMTHLRAVVKTAS